MLKARFPIGTQYMVGSGKIKYECTVVDILKTYNNANELIAIRYTTAHVFCGQIVHNHNVLDTTIARNLLPEFQHLLK